MNDKNWGGKRKGAGRPVQGIKKLVEQTKVCRIDLRHYENIKSGKYDDLMQLLYDYKLETVQNKKSITSPRYQKLNDFLQEASKILGDDINNWVE